MPQDITTIALGILASLISAAIPFGILEKDQAKVIVERIIELAPFPILILVILVCVGCVSYWIYLAVRRRHRRKWHPLEALAEESDVELKELLKDSALFYNAMKEQGRSTKEMLELKRLRSQRNQNSEGIDRCDTATSSQPLQKRRRLEELLDQGEDTPNEVTSINSFGQMVCKALVVAYGTFMVMCSAFVAWLHIDATATGLDSPRIGFFAEVGLRIIGCFVAVLIVANLPEYQQVEFGEITGVALLPFASGFTALTFFCYTCIAFFDCVDPEKALWRFREGLAFFIIFIGSTVCSTIFVAFGGFSSVEIKATHDLRYCFAVNVLCPQFCNAMARYAWWGSPAVFISFSVSLACLYLFHGIGHFRIDLPD